MKKNIFVGMMVALVFIGGVSIAAPSVSALTVDEIQVQIKALLAKIAELTQQMNILQGQTDASAPSQYRICSVLYRNLSNGAQGDDVRGLQEFLSEQGYFSANATGYFGPLTASALARWQASQGIASVGAAGPLTRERIKAWCGMRSGLSASPSYGVAPLGVQFSYQPNAEGGQYYIDFGDGGGQLMNTHQIYCIRAPCISPAVASHTYTLAGTYTATVSIYIACLYSDPRCMVAQPPPLAQTTVIVRSASTSNLPPVISSFSGPTSLAVNASGTWSIQASDPENQQLSYRVTWGDEYSNLLPYASVGMTSDAFVQTTTFTHAYAYAGTYTVTILVHDAAGKEAKTSTTVQVGAISACTLQYDPVCGQPPEPACRYSIPACMMATPGPQTYGNRCMLNAAGATFLYSGQCNTYPVACTADAMQCPNGSYVGRTGPNCQFICPSN